MKKTLLFSLALMILMAGCSKDDDATIRGKWKVQSSVLKEYMNNSLVDTETAPGDGTTLDFRSNNELVITSPGSVETETWNMVSDNVIEFFGVQFEIRDLKESSVTLFNREDYGPGQYDEVYIYLVR